MTAWSTSPLSELCEINIGRTPPRNTPQYWGDGHLWLSIADMQQGKELLSTKEQITPAAAREVMASSVAVGTVALSFKLSIGKVGIVRAPMYTNEAIATLPIKDPDRISPEFLYWALRSINLTAETDDAAMGKVLNKAKLGRLEIPVPPDDDQKRIVDVLDRADALVSQRSRSSSLVDDLAEAILRDMFGDPDENPRGLSVDVFANVLDESPRNGVSPSSDGTVVARVLTLSAITGSAFQESAAKLGTFKVMPTAKHLVSSQDFLVCRGNGNLGLVGRGFFPTRDLPDTAFPDTVIAARINRDRIVPEYLEYVWRTSAIRRQIEGSARTTNGTHKINQKALERIQLMVPPLDEQERFAARAIDLSQVKALQSAQSAQLTDLFASLQHSAFAGTL